jgi:hypothetical protein
MTFKTSPSTSLMVSKLTELAALGKSYAEAAHEIGARYHYVAAFASRHGIQFAQCKRGRKLTAAPDARSEDMRQLYLAGVILNDIGTKYGVTRERVRQILTKFYGIRAPDGGKSKRAAIRKSGIQKARDVRALKFWGCTYKQYLSLLRRPDKPTYAFVGQHRNANSRGIAWELNLWQWWKIWQQSGHWQQRGTGRGYCMCRLNDTGPYAVDNVYIATGSDNMKDYWVNRRAAENMEAAA